MLHAFKPETHECLFVSYFIFGVFEHVLELEPIDYTYQGHSDGGVYWYLYPQNKFLATPLTLVKI